MNDDDWKAGDVVLWCGIDEWRLDDVDPEDGSWNATLIGGQSEVGDHVSFSLHMLRSPSAKRQLEPAPRTGRTP